MILGILEWAERSPYRGVS